MRMLYTPERDDSLINIGDEKNVTIKYWTT